MKNRARVLPITFMLSILPAIIAIAKPVSPSLAERAGVWTTQAVEATLVGPSGAKSAVDLGPARVAALGHLDSDGVIDLVVAYEADSGAVLSLSLGDIRFRRGPHHDLEREKLGLPPERPFSETATIYPLPFLPDWMAVGDWDADGDFDLVCAARGRSQLYWMAGDGTGRLTAGGKIALEGAVTAFAAADVNRRDGLDDLLVGVNGPNGPALLVFESALGALMEEPEAQAMPAPITSLAADWVDHKPYKDIVAATGDHVVLISGRDRKLVLSKARRAAVPRAEIETLDFDAAVLDIAVGHFVGEKVERQLAVRLESGAVKLVRNGGEGFEVSKLGQLPAGGRMLSARAAGLRGHDLIVVDAAAQGLEIFHAEERMKAGGARLEKISGPGGAVREIVAGRLNTDTRDDLVLIGADGEVEVAATKSRLAIEVNSSDDTDDGTCDATHCSLREAINYANALPAGSTITFSLALGDWTIEPGSALPEWTQTGASSIDGTVGSWPVTGRVTLQGASAGEGVDGLTVDGGNLSVSKLLIRGFDGNGIKLLLYGDNNQVMGCVIGLDGTGEGADPNSNNGIAVGEADTTIGGTAAGEGNVISGNGDHGVFVGWGGDDVTILGNLIGTNISGTTAVGNGDDGIKVFHIARTQVGSGVSGGGNLISGNGAGISLSSHTGETLESLVIGNLIGVDLDGTAAVGNHKKGILANAEGVTIGGTSPGTRNVIAATLDPPGFPLDGNGISVGSDDNIQVIGNYIGTDADGTVALGHVRSGIRVDGTTNVIIGGEVAGAGNLISGNGDFGISFEDASDGEVYGNLIGVASDGVTPLGNETSGIGVWGTTDITIGSFNGQNTIAYNASVYGLSSAGISIGGSSSAGIDIGPNSIHDNARSGSTRLGIDLGVDGVTSNDPLDADTGPNGLQNFPEIVAADSSTGSITFQLHSTPSTIFHVLLYANTSCDESGYGEGETYLGGAYVQTDTNGEVEEQVNSLSFTAGQFITATATSSDGNTSEFSMCFEVPANADEIFSDGFESGTGSWSNVVGT